MIETRIRPAMPWAHRIQWEHEMEIAACYQAAQLAAIRTDKARRSK